MASGIKMPVDCGKLREWVSGVALLRHGRAALRTEEGDRDLPAGMSDLGYEAT